MVTCASRSRRVSYGTEVPLQLLERPRHGLDRAVVITGRCGVLTLLEPPLSALQVLSVPLDRHTAVRARLDHGDPIVADPYVFDGVTIGVCHTVAGALYAPPQR